MRGLGGSKASQRGARRRGGEFIIYHSSIIRRRSKKTQEKLKKRTKVRIRFELATRKAAIRGFLILAGVKSLAVSRPSWKASGTARKGAERRFGDRRRAGRRIVITHVKTQHPRPKMSAFTMASVGASAALPVSPAVARRVSATFRWLRQHEGIFSIRSGARRCACASRLGRWDLAGRRHRRRRGCTEAHIPRLALVLGLERRDRTSRVRAVKAPPCHRSIAPRRRASKISRGIRRAAPRRASTTAGNRRNRAERA